MGARELMADEFWLAFASLIVVMGPWKAGIVYAEKTALFPLHLRRIIAAAAVIIAFAIALVFVLIGSNLVAFFHISDAAFLVAAGLLLLVFAIRMVILEEHHEAPVEAVDPEELESRAYRLAAYPLAVPLLITPPGIVTLVALSVEEDVTDWNTIALIGAIIVVLLFDLIVFLVEARWHDVIAKEIWEIAGRILGVLLAGFGVTVIIQGLQLAGIVPGG